MKPRKFWHQKIEQSWKRRSVLWLSGVRRVGKTCLCKTLSGVEYFDCELPRIRRLMDSPEDFLGGMQGKRIVLDEIHRLENPSQILKIAADHFPSVHVVATGSSTLGASSKFKDTLVGRKEELWLTPAMSADLTDLGTRDLKRRLFHGGLPPFLLAEALPERDFQEWMDAFWAKDVQELFRLERRYSFQKFFELLMAQSGGIFEATRFARPCEVSRTTISNYLAVLEAAFVVHVLRPFSTNPAREVVSAPKVYGFDTGFVCYFKGWQQLRTEDLGFLWEHFVLNEIHAQLQTRDVCYWRDKRGREIDFILQPRAGASVAIECKWSADDFDATALRVFRSLHPGGTNYVVAADVQRPITRVKDDFRVEFVDLETLIRRLTPARTRGRAGPSRLRKG